ncbi:MAG: hypothetical protein KJ630_14035, partial [Proteobacteria bacterium]|nr:hypothetical protein [Pseudomonadota bacterium]
CYPAIMNQTSAMDIIFCRNVLIYFSRERAITIIENLARCLVDGGWLVIGPTDAPGSRFSPLLTPVSFPGAMLYRRETLQPAAELSRNARMLVQEKKKNAPSAKTKGVQIAASQKPRNNLAASPDVPPPNTGKMADQVRLLANQGKLQDALALSETAIQTDKLNCALHYLQATILQEMDRQEDAELTLKRTIYINQDFAVAHFALGHLLQRRGKKKESGKHLDKACTLLKSYGHDYVLPEGEGISAGRMIELINRMKG